MLNCIFCNTKLPSYLECKCKVFEHTIFKNIHYYYKIMCNDSRYNSINLNTFDFETNNFCLNFNLNVDNVVIVTLYVEYGIKIYQTDQNIDNLLEIIPKPTSLEANIIKDYIFNLNEQLNILNLFS